MAHQLEAIFGELGLTHYLDAFLDQGFDSWETILDITESDLDTLNVKLGHRRKLQRRIANSRGIAPDVALGSPTSIRQSIEGQTGAPKPDGAKNDVKESGITKRKYHRHPKRDVHAPERPPSAYVLFSNKMREDLKGRTLSFTEIAKLVGENWQSLTPSEKEPFESQAQQAKEKYIRDLAEYKKTPEYRQYNQYLHDFRLKHSGQFQDKETQKRPRLESSNLPHGSTSSSTPGASTPSGNKSATASDESQQGSDPSPSPNYAIAEPSSASPTPLSFHRGVDESLNSSGTQGYFESMEKPSEPFSRDGHRHHPCRSASWKDGGMPPSETGSRPHHLPSLSDVFDARGPIDNFAQSPPEVTGFTGFMQTHHRSGPGPPSAGPTHLEPRAPQLLSLRNGQSSSSSNSSGSSLASSAPSSYSSYSRAHSEASLPIHALLSSRGIGSQLELQPSPAPSKQKSPSYSNSNQSTFLHLSPPNRTVTNISNTTEFAGSLSGYQSPPPITGHHPPGVASRDAPQPSENLSSRERGTNVKEEPNDMDGMSALLRAGEIVDQRNR